jgi:ribosome-associated protein
MVGDNAVSITSGLQIPLAELSFQASRSGGPGGQHVNTSSTRIELWWNARESPSLSAQQRTQVEARLGKRLTEGGMLRIVAAASRSQAQNKAAAIERFRELLGRALVVPKRRRPTRPSRGAKERRLAEKRKQGDRKRERRLPPGED